MCRINDLGDVPLSEGNNNERSIEMITDFYRSIDAAGAKPVSIGGDHSITGGILQAIGGHEANLTGGERACLLHFDAHTDAFHNIPHFMGAIKSAAHWASYLVTDGHVDAEHSVQVGIRGNTRSLDWLEPSYSLGYEVIKKSDYDQMGAESVIETIHDHIGDRPVYITFDLDCLDPTVAPGVANIGRDRRLRDGPGHGAHPLDAGAQRDRRRRGVPYADGGLAQPDHQLSLDVGDVRDPKPDRRPELQPPVGFPIHSRRPAR